ncbi:hypothetical protein [Enterococcus dispar]|uniref:hypothetical protein n=1 Tax=Enterococcus dispar TaxID=44009 RepID=UPI0028919623|nr:hypothetical protein [Enterococcus dispar]MDT2704786.1 hypothetical protein [Enterococcus dispar]
MKNDLTAMEWLALAIALDFMNEVSLYELRGDVVPVYESAAEKIKKIAVEIEERTR